MARAQEAAPLVSLLDVPYISQSEALCGGAAAAMVLRYWGERGIDAESFAPLVDRSAAGIRTDVLAKAIGDRGWVAAPVVGDEALARGELARGRPVLALIEDRPGAFHYVVIVAWHDRGIVFHDPARAPFRVMGRDEFSRRWDVAARWMLVVVPRPGSDPLHVPTRGSDPLHAATQGCEQLVRTGVAAAQASDLGGAERALTAALACPGAAAARELAGVRLLQRRWPEVTELARVAVTSDPADAHAWKLLGTSLFVQDDRRGALDAWNHAGEPRVDLVRIDGLDRTRHRVVEQLLGTRAGDVLTPSAFERARRRLAMLPAATATRLDYAPAPGGLAELRGAVAERPLAPTSRLELVTIGVAALGRREINVALASPTGSGERMDLAWRFWPQRPRAALGLAAPAPWGGTWGVDADHERQPFDLALPTAERTTARVSVAHWATAALRWDVGAGVERRREDDSRRTLLAGGLAAITPGDRLEASFRATRRIGSRGYGLAEALVRVRSRAESRGVVLLGSLAVQHATVATPLDAWPAGDTGHARATLLRAHPVLDEGRLRVDRLGRTVTAGTVEGRRWWAVTPLLRLAPAVFVDVGRTARRRSGPALHDVDAGLGLRLGILGIPGILRVDAARGLRDGSTAVILAYDP